MDKPTVVRLKYDEDQKCLIPVMPNGEEIPYVSKVIVESKVGDLVSVIIECVAVDECLIDNQYPIYQVIINADPTKIDVTKIMDKYKNLLLLKP